MLLLVEGFAAFFVMPNQNQEPHTFDSISGNRVVSTTTAPAACRKRHRSAVFFASLGGRSAGARSRSSKDLKVAEQVPKDAEDDDGAEAATAELLGSPASRYTTQKLTHGG